ncbi:MAG: DNA-deoxyinosine glycosylase [Gammaproteobacteria bacterium]|nr:DNA-deoxyinosine glycosylase [Gammaproteobacteria bacterium]
MPGFPPLLGENADVLILGSMPSQRSLASRQYYAHPQNSFWWLMSKLCDFDSTLDYRNRAKRLTAAGYAVWDVLYDCERPGSLDSAIHRDGQTPNAFAALLAEHPEIRLLAFNGAAAEKLFHRHCGELIKRLELSSVRLPSSSPAMAILSKTQKLEQWRKLLT